ncbi:phosphatase PAP2 family protein [Bradyrhizobium diazoefficiens]|uniref:phosphatase PAP2 family protein n=1 Tax=Bradyrhizobium diazoefficiens TaxID=1355477 RepID=UPI001FEDE1E6|nr:phosphatase PAP2 family protein [Bradyrhizobium diazoefficiens]
MKRPFDQTRPDRRTEIRHLHGVPFSRIREDAFPSGHALHIGALASAAGALPAGPRLAIRAVAVGISLTRLVVLAHWASNVVARFCTGSGSCTVRAAVHRLPARRFDGERSCRPLRI